MKTIAADMSRKIDEGKAEIVGHVDAVGAKVDKLKSRGKRKSKFTDAMREACRSYWEAAQNNAEVRYAINTRVTYESVFRHFARGLAEHGVTTVRQFKAVLHSAQNIECSRRAKKLDEQRDGREKTLPAHGKRDAVKSHAGKKAQT